VELPVCGVTVIVGPEDVPEGGVVAEGAWTALEEAGVVVGCCANAIDPEIVRTTAEDRKDRLRMGVAPGRAGGLPFRRNSLHLL
jgi:hypothetical protein